ncbi:Uncharacterized protein FKW44_000631, partial [Caligus rogercresseyi]
IEMTNGAEAGQKYGTDAGYSDNYGSTQEAEYSATGGAAYYEEDPRTALRRSCYFSPSHESLHSKTISIPQSIQ